MSSLSRSWSRCVRRTAAIGRVLRGYCQPVLALVRFIGVVLWRLFTGVVTAVLVAVALFFAAGVFVASLLLVLVFFCCVTVAAAIEPGSNHRPRLRWVDDIVDGSRE
jgi:hypothetical protein